MGHIALYALGGLVIVVIVAVLLAQRAAARSDAIVKALQDQQAQTRDLARMLERIAISLENRPK